MTLESILYVDCPCCESKRRMIDEPMIGKIRRRKRKALEFKIGKGLFRLQSQLKLERPREMEASTKPKERLDL